MLPIPLIIAGAIMLAGAIGASAQERARARRLPRTGPQTPPAPPPPGDTGYFWQSREWWALHVVLGGSGVSWWMGPRSKTEDEALEWKLDGLELYPGTVTRYVYRGGRWQWAG